LTPVTNLQTSNQFTNKNLSTKELQKLQATKSQITQRNNITAHQATKNYTYSIQ